jgi:membrane protein implicated in regulation of membrane protease activity
VPAVGGHCRIAERDLAEHERAGRRRHPAGQHTAGISLIIAILLALFVLPSPWGLVVVLGAACLEVVEITWGIRLARRRSTVGAQTLVGREAVVVRALEPDGQVTIDGERWQAHSDIPAPVGARVVVERIEGLRLEVRTPQ